jgi:hypothetical protein
MDFFRTSCRNLIAAAEAAHVKHHVALSVVGTDRLLESGYFRAKMVQEDLIKASPIPHTILRSTQFFKFMPDEGAIIGVTRFDDWLEASSISTFAEGRRLPSTPYDTNGDREHEGSEIAGFGRRTSELIALNT